MNHSTLGPWLLTILLAVCGAGCDSGSDAPESGFYGKVTLSYEYENFGPFPPYEACPTLEECSCIPTPNVPLPYVVAGSDFSVETPYAVTFRADVHSVKGDVTVEWRNTLMDQSYFGPEVTIPVRAVRGFWDYIFRSPTGASFIPRCSYGWPGTQSPEASIVFPLEDYGLSVHGPFIGSVIAWLSYDPNEPVLASQVYQLCPRLPGCDLSALSYQTGPGFTCKLVAIPRALYPPVQVSWEKVGGATFTGNEVVGATCADLLGQWKVTMTDAMGNSAMALSAFQNLYNAGISFQIPD